MINWKKGPIPTNLDELAVELGVEHLDTESDANADYAVLEWFMNECGTIPLVEELDLPLSTYMCGDFARIIIPVLVEFNEKHYE